MQTKKVHRVNEMKSHLLVPFVLKIVIAHIWDGGYFIIVNMKDIFSFITVIGLSRLVV